MFVRVLFLFVCALSFLSFFISVFAIFKKPVEQEPRALLILKAGSVMIWAVATIAILNTAAPPTWRVISAFAMQFCSLSLFWWATSVVGRNHLSVAFVPEAPDNIVSAGPFRFLLHPFYTAYLLSYWSVFVFSGSAVVAAAAAGMHVLYSWTAWREEAVLLTKFGERYATQKKHRFSPMLPLG